LHPQEGLLQKARAFQKSEAFKEYCQLRQVAEHRIARLMQLGVRQARYLGRKKTLFQLLMAATVANLTLVATVPSLLWLIFVLFAPRLRFYLNLVPKNRLFDCASSLL
jgi:hypothetical protein